MNDESALSAVLTAEASPSFTAMLPWPPSANNLFSGKARRFPARHYVEWIDAAKRALSRQMVFPIAGPVTIEIELAPPNKRLFDIDNKIKPCIDLLVNRGLIERDDCGIVRKITVSLQADDASHNAAWVTVIGGI